MSEFVSEETQNGEDTSDGPLKNKGNTNIFGLRRDCQQILNKIFECVNRDQYKTVLVSFLHGKITKEVFDAQMGAILVTTKAKVLHNELVRSIIYNAHFSMEPPPNVVIPKPASALLRNDAQMEPPIHLRTENKSYNSADMGHLPSVMQLMMKMEMIIKDKKLEYIEPEASVQIIETVNKYLTTLLNKCLLASANTDSEKKNVIALETAINVISSDKSIKMNISPFILKKYSSIV